MSCNAKKELKALKKGYSFDIIRKGKCKKQRFQDALSALIALNNNQNLKAMILDALEHKGRAYGVKKDKKYVALWIFRYDENYFVEKVNLNPTKSQEKQNEYNQVIYRLFDHTRGALILSELVVMKEHQVVEELFFDDLIRDLKDIFYLEDYAGFEYQEKLYYRNYLKMKFGNNQPTFLVLKPIGLYACGFVFGWLASGDWTMGLMWGFVAFLLGNTFTTANVKEVKVEDQNAVK